VLGAGRAGQRPSRPGQPGLQRGPSGPSGQLLWVILTWYKKFLRAYFVSRKFRKMLELVKIIVIYLYVGKMQMTYQNAQKNMLYLFMSKSCIINQH
jgi:hypothetical protein